MESNNHQLDSIDFEHPAPASLKEEVLVSASAAKLVLELVALFSTTAGEAIGSIMRTEDPKDIKKEE